MDQGSARRRLGMGTYRSDTVLQCLDTLSADSTRSGGGLG